MVHYEAEYRCAVVARNGAQARAFARVLPCAREVQAARRARASPPARVVQKSQVEPVDPIDRCDLWLACRCARAVLDDHRTSLLRLRVASPAPVLARAPPHSLPVSLEHLLLDEHALVVPVTHLNREIDLHPDRHRSEGSFLDQFA